MREIDPDLPILSIAPFVDLMQKSVGLWVVKLGATLFGAFGGIALLLAVVGVYGVKAYAVACRTREIGIRMALGAHRSDVFALIMRQGAMQTALAVSVGLLLSLAAGRVLSQILYEVSPTDPLRPDHFDRSARRCRAPGLFSSRAPRDAREPDHSFADGIERRIFAASRIKPGFRIIFVFVCCDASRTNREKQSIKLRLRQLISS